MQSFTHSMELLILLHVNPLVTGREARRYARHTDAQAAPPSPAAPWASTHPLPLLQSTCFPPPRPGIFIGHRSPARSLRVNLHKKLFRINNKKRGLRGASRQQYPASSVTSVGPTLVLLINMLILCSRRRKMGDESWDEDDDKGHWRREMMIG